MRNLIAIGLSVAVLGLSACSSSEPTPTKTTNAAGEAFNNAASALSKLDNFMPNNSSSAATGSTTQMLGVGAPNNIWSGAGWMSDPRCSGGSSDPHCSTGPVNLQFYMGFL